MIALAQFQCTKEKQSLLYIHRSAITDKVNNTGSLIILAPVSEWDILGSKDQI